MPTFIPLIQRRAKRNKEAMADIKKPAPEPEPEYSSINKLKQFFH